MTAARAQAYGRVMRTLRELAPTQLLPAEQVMIREVCDSLVFCADAASETAQLALLEVDALMRRLVQSGRWTAERAERLHADIRTCGPAPAADALTRAA
jgi:hypothetical protein